MIRPMLFRAPAYHFLPLILLPPQTPDACQPRNSRGIHHVLRMILMFLCRIDHCQSVHTQFHISLDMLRITEVIYRNLVILIHQK